MVSRRPRAGASPRRRTRTRAQRSRSSAGSPDAPRCFFHTALLPGIDLRLANSSCAARIVSRVTRRLARRPEPVGESGDAGDRDRLPCRRVGRRRRRSTSARASRVVDVEDERTRIVERRRGRRRGPSWRGSPARPGARPCARRSRSNSHSSTNARPPSISPPGRSGIVEQAVEQVVPLLLERQAALELVEHREAREAVRPRSGSRRATGGRTRATCRSGRGRADRAQRRPARSTAAPSRARTRVRSSAAAFSVNVIAAMAVMSTPASTRLTMRLDERTRLAGPGARLDEQRGVEVVADAVARRVVGRERVRVRRRRAVEVEPQLLRSRSSSPARRVDVTRCRTSGARRGSWCLRSHSAQRSPVPNSSGSQYATRDVHAPARPVGPVREPARLDAVDDVGQLRRHQLGDLGGDRVPVAFVVALAHQPVLGAHLDLGVADHAARRCGVGRQLEHGGVERRVLRAEVAVALARTGLVIGDDDGAGRRCDRCGRPCRRDGACGRRRAATRPARQGRRRNAARRR